MGNCERGRLKGKSCGGRPNTFNVTMPDRSMELYIAETTLPLPCFFPSVSSVKTNLMPIDYVELLDAAAHPLFLVSAYDILKCTADQRPRLDAALTRSKERRSVILLDSGNYERFWKADPSWQSGGFHEIASATHHHLCFCYDNQETQGDSLSIARDVVASVLRDQEHAIGSVVPIVHGSAALLPDAAFSAAAELYPMLLAVPERALGAGIVERTQTVRNIREALSELEVYCPLHLLGTGNPLSIIAYALAGADSFDGLEWCQTAIDHDTGRLLHFQHWDLLRHQTEWGRNSALPYIQSVLMHNLSFYGQLMADLREAIRAGCGSAFLRRFATADQVAVLFAAIEEGK